MHTIAVDWIPAPEDPGAGGALIPWRESLVLFTRAGSFHQLRADESGFDALDITAPFDLAAQVALFDARINKFSIGGRGAALRDRDGRIDLYVTHTVGYPAQDCITVAVSRTQVTEAADGRLAQTGTWSRVFETTPCLEAAHSAIIALQAGGPMAVHPDGGILFEVGEFSIDGVFRHRDTVYPQDPKVSYGKLWYLDPDTDEARIYSLGHRNASGLSVSASGRIWMTEHGPKGGDEINLIEDGENYGWPLVTYGLKYGEPVWPPAVSSKIGPDTTLPVFSWLPSIAVSGVVEITGDEFPFWQGDILAGSLAAQKLVRLRLAEDRRVVYQEDIPIGHRIRALAQLPSGRLALKLDWQPFVLLLSATDTVTAGIPDALEPCANCHALTAGGFGGSGPSLANVLDRDIAALPGYDYSDALKTAQGAWDQDTLKAYLLDPGTFAPGTKMANLGLEEADVTKVLDALADMAGEKLD